MKEQGIRKLLKSGEVLAGPWCTIPSSSVINIIAASGLDFVIIDLEHGPISIQTAENMVRAAASEDCFSLIRVGKNDEAVILKALDIGADGIIVPHIESKDDAEAAIKYSKYFPLGSRGFSPFTRAGRYRNQENHASDQNKQTLLAIILEGEKGISNLDDILSIDEISRKLDVIYIGAYDLSQALGVPGQVDHPKVKEYLESCITKIKNAGLAAGGYVAKNKEDLAWMCQTGMQFITLLPDCSVIYEAFHSLNSDFLSTKSDLKRG